MKLTTILQILVIASISGAHAVVFTKGTSALTDFGDKTSKVQKGKYWAKADLIDKMIANADKDYTTFITTTGAHDTENVKAVHALLHSEDDEDNDRQDREPPKDRNKSTKLTVRDLLDANIKLTNRELAALRNIGESHELDEYVIKHAVTRPHREDVRKFLKRSLDGNSQRTADLSVHAIPLNE